MWTKVVSLLRREDGATMVEYSVMVALIAAVCIIVVEILGGGTQSLYQSVVDLWP